METGYKEELEAEGEVEFQTRMENIRGAHEQGSQLQRRKWSIRPWMNFRAGGGPRWRCGPDG